MIRLSLECSSGERSVALARDRTVLAEVSHPSGRSTPILAMIEEVLDRGGLGRDAVEMLVVGLGPGSYTGIRGALAVAGGWHLGRGVPVCGGDSVLACAHRAHRAGARGQTAVLIDAQRGEFYVATYDLGDAGIVPGEALRLATRPEVEALAVSGVQCVGPAAGVGGIPGTTVAPDAAGLVATLPEPMPRSASGPLEPVYLRPVAFVKAPPPRPDLGHVP